ncbi:hypothetical protein V8G54_030892 [Vigna mungo]|uniref:HMA domain-containing protein n=1 Tax=Vigna mungo TaxID=3915 RepID=A0AAQ3RLP2_VIGMU
MQGVYDIDIDQKQHKVVVTGNVDGELLIWKLTKAGKHAELWPENADSGKKKQGNSESKEKRQSDAESSDDGIKKNDKEDVKVVAQDPSKNAEGSNNNNNSTKSKAVKKNSDGCAAGKAAVQLHEPKPEVRQTVVLQPAGPVTEKKVSIAVQVPNDNEATGNENTTGGAGADGAGGAKKKKKKVTATGKESNSNNGNDVASDAKAKEGSSNQSNGQAHVHEPAVPVSSSVPFAIPTNDSATRHHHFYREYPPHYYAPPPAPPQVVHSVSYHTAHPSSSYGAAYYAPTRPVSYAHVVRPGYEVEPPPYMYEAPSYAPSYTPSYAPSQPSDSFELFSDENPNACSLM